MEDGFGIGHDLFGVLEFHDLQPIFLFHDFADTQVLVGDTVRNVNLKLVPVLVFDVAQALQMFRVIGIVIYRCHGAQLVKSFDQHPFVVHVSETQRAVHLGHPFLFRPFFDGGKQRINHLLVVDEIDKPEAGAFLFPDLIAGPVDDTCNASCNLPVFVG